MARARRLGPAPVTALVTALVMLSSGGLVQAESVRFAVYGDMPYTADDRVFLEGPAAERIRHDDALAFVISVGDLGRPEGACTDAWQQAQRRLWNSGFLKPVFHTPGDNDWTDCDRPTLGAPVSELVRLDAIRRIHFAGAPVADPHWDYRQQPGQPENAIWRSGGVRFATLHVVGTSNGRRQIHLDDRSLALALADARDAATRVWIDTAFRAARQAGDRAVVLAMQADPFAPGLVDRAVGSGATTLERCFASPAFGPTCRALAAQAVGFDGPVLLVHGDTRAVCLEAVRAIDGTRLFWRLNVWGDFSAPELAVVEVDPADRERPVRVTGAVGGAAPPAVCGY